MRMNLKQIAQCAARPGGDGAHRLAGHRNGRHLGLPRRGRGRRLRGASRRAGRRPRLRGGRPSPRGAGGAGHAARGRRGAVASPASWGRRCWRFPTRPMPWRTWPAAVAPASGRQSGGGDRVHRQDHYEEPHPRRGVRGVFGVRHPGQPEQRAGRAQDGAASRGRHPGGGRGDGHARGRPNHRAVRLRPSRLGRGGQRRRGWRLRALGQPRKHCARQGRAFLRPARRGGGRRSSTPTTTSPICSPRRQTLGMRARWRRSSSTAAPRRPTAISAAWTPIRPIATTACGPPTRPWTSRVARASFCIAGDSWKGSPGWRRPASAACRCVASTTSRTPAPLRPWAGRSASRWKRAPRRSPPRFPKRGARRSFPPPAASR